MIFIEPLNVYALRTACDAQATEPNLRRVTSIRGHKMWEHMRQYGGAPVGLWKVIGALVKAERPCDREDARSRAVYYWVGFRELRRAGLIFRHFGLIATKDFAYAPSQKWRKTLVPTARPSDSQNAVSNVPPPTVISVRQQDHPPQIQGAKPILPCLPIPVKTQSARPSADHVNDAIMTVIRPAAGAVLFAGSAGHRVHSVQNQVQQNLLQMHAVTANGR